MSRTLPTELFRAEALAVRRAGAPDTGRVVGGVPRWVGRAYLALVGSTVVAGAVLLSVEVNRYVEVAAVLLEDEAGRRVVALVPGTHAPQLEVGTPLHVEFPGHSGPGIDLSIEDISIHVVEPDDVADRLGVSATVRVPGPVVLATASSDEGFAKSGEAGMNSGELGTAVVRAGSERLIFVLVPGLKAWRDDAGG